MLLKAIKHQIQLVLYKTCTNIHTHPHTVQVDCVQAGNSVTTTCFQYLSTDSIPQDGWVTLTPSGNLLRRIKNINIVIYNNNIQHSNFTCNCPYFQTFFFPENMITILCGYFFITSTTLGNILHFYSQKYLINTSNNIYILNQSKHMLVNVLHGLCFLWIFKYTSFKVYGPVIKAMKIDTESKIWMGNDTQSKHTVDVHCIFIFLCHFGLWLLYVLVSDGPLVVSSTSTVK